MKTPEEMAEEWMNEEYGDTSHWVRMGKDMSIDAFLAGYQAAAPQWISVKDRLPENSFLTVLVDFKVTDSNAKLFSLGYYERSKNSSGEWYVQSNSHREKVEVTHWMPLPDGPKEEK
jgi:hypothetical protein